PDLHRRLRLRLLGHRELRHPRPAAHAGRALRPRVPRPPAGRRRGRIGTRRRPGDRGTRRVTDPGWASRRPARTAGVLATAVGDELVLWNPFDRTSHVLNRTARQVWEALDGERTVDELASALAAAFGASLRTVRRDVRRLVGALAEAELVDGPEGRPLP